MTQFSTSNPSRSNAARAASGSSSRRSGRRAGAAICAAVVALGLGGCGGSNDDAGDKVASVDDLESGGTTPGADDGATGDTGSELEKSYEETNQEFEDCMLEQGVELPDLDPVTGNTVEGDPGAEEPIDFQWGKEEEAAAEVCGPILEQFDPYAGMNAEQRAAADNLYLEFEKCMEDAGFPLPQTDQADPDEQTEPEEIFNDMTKEEYQEFEDAATACETSISIPPELENFGTEPSQ